MIEKIFDWGSCDPMDLLDFQYNHCTLNQPFGEIAEGTKIPIIFISYELGKIILYNRENEILFTGKLTISVE